MQVALCILTKNEYLCLKELMPNILKSCKNNNITEIFGIDGGSVDGTLEVYRENNIKTFTQISKGRGDAFQLAFKNINADLYIFFSPDGNENEEDFGKFIELTKNGAEIVIASRMMKESFNEEDDQLIKLRKWANNIFNLMANISFRRNGPYITDSINGYRSITKDVANSLKLDALDYTIEYQMTMRAMKSKIKISEFPTIEGKRLYGETQAKSIPTGLKFIKCYLKELFS
tara:strand:+ start:597 stop:1289 length:693 start_codon:yes stop_codon:yes gene_type:complete